VSRSRLHEKLFAKHGENRTFLGQIVETYKCPSFIMFISYKYNQATTQLKKNGKYTTFMRSEYVLNFNFNFKIVYKVKFESLLWG